MPTLTQEATVDFSLTAEQRAIQGVTQPPAEQVA